VPLVTNVGLASQTNSDQIRRPARSGRCASARRKPRADQFTPGHGGLPSCRVSRSAQTANVAAPPQAKLAPDPSLARNGRGARCRVRCEFCQRQERPGGLRQTKGGSKEPPKIANRTRLRTAKQEYLRAYVCQQQTHGWRRAGSERLELLGLQAAFRGSQSRPVPPLVALPETQLSGAELSIITTRMKTSK
jgi:hypothetical protein